jgi:hypothetical protein
MNLAFELKNDEELREGGSLQPYEIVSLYEVLDFHADKFANICRLMSELCMIPLTESPKWELSQPILDQLQWLKDAAQELALTGLVASIERLLRDLERVDTAGNKQIKRDAHAILQRIIDDFKGQCVMAVKAKQGEYYERTGTFLGDEVINRLSSLSGLIEDASEAGNCYAFERYTACVFHLMRLVERCVQKLGNDLGLPDALTYEKEWQIILNRIRGEVKTKWPRERDPNRIRHESIISHLETVKIVWRNPTMHPKATYTQNEAKKIMASVQAFVEDFSTL